MEKGHLKVTGKLYFKRYVIGICKDQIENIIRNKTFDPEIKWLPLRSFRKFQADPFIVSLEDESINIVLEEFAYKDHYARIALLTLDKSFGKIGYKNLLDTKSHISYPFVFSENDKIYLFPEAKRSGKLSCYEFHPEPANLSFVKHVLEVPLVDATIIKHNDSYWIFGSSFREDKKYELFVYFSDNLLGPYTAHSANPVKVGFDGIRSAGAFFVVDGCIYRPTQNCEIEYGDSITINKVTQLNKANIIEEPYMKISISRNNSHNRKLHTIHTINIKGDFIVVDGKYWTFSPFYKLFVYLRDLIHRFA
jgi:hypothetical protein